MISLAVVTATTNLERAQACIESWRKLATAPPAIFVVLNGRPFTAYDAAQSVGYEAVYTSSDYIGSVKAFRIGVDMALAVVNKYSIIACLHDDFEILEADWDEKVAKYFDRRPQMGLAGFGGAVGLGEDGMYERPYDPMSLARHGFRSNLVDAEAHGIRSLLGERVACLDGFSQVGYRRFWEGATFSPGAPFRGEPITAYVEDGQPRPWVKLEELGFVHHFYDGALGCLAARYGWETWYIPLRSQHYGGRTAVGDKGYGEWAKTQDPKGDQGFWEAAHRIGYQEFRDVLPLRV